MGRGVGVVTKRNGDALRRTAPYFMLFAALCAAVALGGVQSTLRAQHQNDPPAQGAQAKKDAVSLEGSWDIVITSTPNPPFRIPFRILRTVSTSGVVDAYAFPSITPTKGALINSPGHGSWTRIGPRTFSCTVIYFQLNPNVFPDQLDTIGKVRETIILDRDGNSYSSAFETTISLPDGTPIIKNTGVTKATRIKVEPFELPLP